MNQEMGELMKKDVVYMQEKEYRRNQGMIQWIGLRFQQGNETDRGSTTVSGWKRGTWPSAIGLKRRISRYLGGTVIVQNPYSVQLM